MRRDSKEVHACACAHVICVDKSQIRLVHQRSGAECGIAVPMPAVPMGNRNLFLPGAGFLYIAPSLVLHYIDAHQYLPPDEFIKAVLDCPPTRSQEYQKAVQACAPKGLFS